MSLNLEYTYPVDDISGLVTPTLTVGSQATGYPPGKLSNGDPSFPFKVDSTTFRLVWDFGSPKTIARVVIVHANFQAGLTGLKAEMNASNAWGGPSVSVPITVPAYHEDDFPVNISVDVNQTYQYFSLAATSANIVNIAIGEVILATQVRTLVGHYLVLQGPGEEEDHPLVEHQTDVGVSTIYGFGTRRRWIRGSILQNESNGTTVRSWNRAAQGRLLPFVIWPQLTPAEPWYVRFEDTRMRRTYVSPGAHSRFDLNFDEVARGLVPTPSAV